MTHHPHHAGHETTLPIYHPRPVVHPYIPPNSGFIPGRSNVAGLPPRFVRPGRHPLQLAGQIGQLGVQLHSATHTGGSESTRAHLHAQAILAELQKELGQIGGRNILSPRIHTLQKELDNALAILEHPSEQAAAAFSWN